MTESLTDIEARLKEAQQKAIELQQQRENLRQEQIEKIRGEDLKTEAVTIHKGMTDIERNELEKYVEHLPDRLELLMNNQRLQHHGMGFNHAQPVFTPDQEARLLDDAIRKLEDGQKLNVQYQTKDLQQEWSAVAQKVQEQQAEIEKITANRDQLKEQGLDKIAAMSVKRDYAELNNEPKAQQTHENKQKDFEGFQKRDDNLEPSLKHDREAITKQFGAIIPNGGKDLDEEGWKEWEDRYDKFTADKSHERAGASHDRTNTRDDRER